MAEVCALIPWWGRDGFTRELAARVSNRQLPLVWLLQLLAGPSGVVGFGAATLAGAAIGCHIHNDGGKVTRSLLMHGGLCCAVAFGAGLFLTCWLLVRPQGMPPGPAEAVFTLGNANARLLWGGVDAAILLICLGIGRHPARVEVWERCSRALRRFGRLSFTLYACERTVAKAAVVPLVLVAKFVGWLPVRDASLSLAFRNGAAHELLAFAHAAAPVASWAVVLAAWERAGFVGSFEWACRAAASPRPAGSGSPAPGRATSSERVTATGKERTHMLCVWLCLIWTPALAWSALASCVVAPLVQDYEWSTGAMALLHDARDYPAADPRIGLHRPKMSFVLFTYSALIALVASMRWLRKARPAERALSWQSVHRSSAAAPLRMATVFAVTAAVLTSAGLMCWLGWRGVLTAPLLLGQAASRPRFIRAVRWRRAVAAICAAAAVHTILWQRAKPSMPLLPVRRLAEAGLTVELFVLEHMRARVPALITLAQPEASRDGGLEAVLRSAACASQRVDLLNPLHRALLGAAERSWLTERFLHVALLLAGEGSGGLVALRARANMTLAHLVRQLDAAPVQPRLAGFGFVWLSWLLQSWGLTRVVGTLKAFSLGLTSSHLYLSDVVPAAALSSCAGAVRAALAHHGASEQHVSSFDAALQRSNLSRGTSPRLPPQTRLFYGAPGTASYPLHVDVDRGDLFFRVVSRLPPAAHLP